MKKKSLYMNKEIGFALFAVGLSIWLIIAVTFFVRESDAIENDAIDFELAELTQSNKNTINYTFEEFFTDLRQKASQISDHEKFTHETLEKFFDNTVRAQFAYLSITFADGQSLISNGTITHINDKTFLESMQTGKEIVTDIHIDPVLNKRVVAFCVPIIMNEKSSGAYLRAVITTEELTKVYNTILFTDGGEYHIIDGEGQHIVADKSSDPLLASYEFNQDGTIYFSGIVGENEELKIEHLYKNNPHLLRYTLANEVRYLHYLPLGVNCWIVVTIMPQEIVEANAAKHRSNAMMLLLNISIIITLAYWYIYSTKKQEANNLQLIGESLRLLANHSGIIILEWNLKKNTINVHSSSDKNLHPSFYKPSAKPEVLIPELIHPDDINRVLDSHKHIKGKEPIPTITIRIKNENSEYIWTEVDHIVVQDKKGINQKVFVFIRDVNEDMETSIQLLERAEHDSLTDLYNKATTENKIIEALRDQRNYPVALFIVDLDNFKAINDTFGHLYGDQVLQEVAQKLKNNFRSNDIVGRIGGDEFFVFMKSIYNTNQVKSKAKDLTDQLNISYIEDGVKVSISASIGIAISEIQNSDFKALYNSADKALYKIKKSTKNGYQISYYRITQEQD